MTIALKFIIAILTGLMGLLVGVARIKDRHKRLTRSGILLIIGIILSSALSVGLAVRESRELAKHDAAVEREFDRLLNPFIVAAFEMHVEYPFDHPDLQPWLNNIRSAIETKGSQSTLPFPVSVTNIGVFTRLHGQLECLTSRVDVWLPEPSDAFAMKVLRLSSVRVSFHGAGPRAQNDLAYLLDAPTSHIPAGTTAELERKTWQHTPFRSFAALVIDFDKRRITRTIVVASPKPLVNNGKVSSTSDLAAGSIVIWAPLLAEADAHVTQLRLYPNKSMAAYLEVPVARAQVFNEKEPSPIAYIIDVRPGDFSLHSHDPFLSPER